MRENDPSHADSRAFLDALPGRAVLIILPTLIAPEIAGAIRRFTGRSDIAQEALGLLDPLPNLNLVPLDRRLAFHAAGIAADTGLRGCDAVFAATARMFDSVIISLDKEHASRCPKDPRTLTPSEGLVELEAAG